MRTIIAILLLTLTVGCKGDLEQTAPRDEEEQAVFTRIYERDHIQIDDVKYRNRWFLLVQTRNGVVIVKMER